jgi:hypothetical protein
MVRRAKPSTQHVTLTVESLPCRSSAVPLKLFCVSPLFCIMMVCTANTAFGDLGAHLSFVRRRISITAPGGGSSAVGMGQRDAVVGSRHDVTGSRGIADASGRTKQPEVMFSGGPEGAVHSPVLLRDRVRHQDPPARQLLWQATTSALIALPVADVGELMDGRRDEFGNAARQRNVVEASEHDDTRGLAAAVPPLSDRSSRVVAVTQAWWRHEGEEPCAPQPPQL